MKLFTEKDQQALQRQYKHGNELESQRVICKIFNPYGPQIWYLLNQDPEDPDYLWLIAYNTDYGKPVVECGSASKSEMEAIEIKVAIKMPNNKVAWHMFVGLERDTWWKPMNAKKVFDKLLKNKPI